MARIPQEELGLVLAPLNNRGIADQTEKVD